MGETSGNIPDHEAAGWPDGWPSESKHRSRGPMSHISRGEPVNIYSARPGRDRRLCELTLRLYVDEDSVAAIEESTVVADGYGALVAQALHANALRMAGLGDGGR